MPSLTEPTSPVPPDAAAGIAALRRRVREMEEINRGLLAFARGHAGAVAAIHEAVVALLAAEGPHDVAAIVTRDWPLLLGVDATALAWSADGRAFAASGGPLRAMEPRLVQRLAGMDRAVSTRAVARGHPLFGPAAAAIRAEVLVRLDGTRGIGLVLLGQRAGAVDEAPAGVRLLRFLGRAASTMLERWPAPPHP